MKEWIAQRDRNLWASLILMILSGAVIREALDLEVGTPTNPGSGFMIFGASSALALLALHQFVQSLRSRAHERESARTPAHRGRIIWVVLATILYVVALQPVGYLLCTFLLLSGLFQTLERGQWISRTIGAAATSFVTYVVFAKLLQLHLPRGLISFF